MKKTTLLPLLMASIALTSMTTVAQPPIDDLNYGPFVGVGLGYYRLNDNDFLDGNDRLKDNQTAWRVFGGYEFNRIFSIEGGYIDFGRTDDGPATLDANGWTLAAMFAWPINDVVSPYAKIGQLMWDSERRLGVFYGDSDGNDMFYGFGARLTMVSHIDMQFGYERFTMDSTDLDMATANVVFRF